MNIIKVAGVAIISILFYMGINAHVQGLKEKMIRPKPDLPDPLIATALIILW